MRSFDDTLELMRIELEQSEGPLILVGICDDTELRSHTIKELRQRLSPDISLRDFRYDPEHLSLLEATVENLQLGNGRVALSVPGLEELPRDKWSEAIKLLNLQRNRFGYTGAAVILWVNRATLAEIANKSADFFSWRSGTFIIEPPPGWDTLESARRSYLQALVAQNEFVNLQGLAPRRGGHIVQMRMEEIFIPLQVEQEKKVETVIFAKGTEGSIDVEVAEDAEGKLVTRGKTEGVKAQFIGDTLQVEGKGWSASVYRGLREERTAHSPLHEIQTRPVEIPDLLQERHAIILGDPGAGKTTLLRYLAYRLAREQATTSKGNSIDIPAELSGCLPVYVRIGEYAQHLQYHPQATLDSFALLSSQAQQLPLSDELLKDALRQGRIVFLLDGLDEILDTSQRRHIALRVEEFARTQPQCRMIETSRIIGYREARLHEEFTQFTIRPFAENEIRRFAENWYAALGQPSNARALIDAIESNASVRRLAANPLLLTVIALIHWRGAKLPQHRAKLYSEAAETLVDQWMSQRRVNPEGWDAHETLHLLLPTIAWRLHSTTSSGLIGEQELHALLVETLRQQDSHLGESEAHSRAAQFRRNVSEFSGIFLERGLDQEGRGLYGFLHLTFEEYFAAVFLADTWEREGKKVLRPLLHHPRWTEVILLTAGRLSDSSQYRATEFVKAILSARSEHEKILHRDLFLAARCLADDVRLDATVRHGIVEKLLKLVFDKRSPSALREDLQQIFARLGGVSAGKDVVQALLRRLMDLEGDVREAAVQTFGQLGASVATPDVVQALLRCLTDSEWNVRGAAVETFGQLGASVATPEVVQALLRCLTDPEGYVRRAAAQTFGQLGASVATPDVVHALLRYLTDPEEYVRGAAAWTFGQLGASVATPEVVQALLRYLTDADGDVRRAAVRTFGQLGASVATSEVVQALLRYLTDSKWYAREVVVRTFGQLGASVATPEVVQALLRYLTDPGEYVRRAAVRTLQKLSGYIRLKEWPEAPTLFVPLARSRNEEKREVGYVCLRNLLAGEQEGTVQ